MDRFVLRLSPAAVRDLDRLEEKVAQTLLDKLTVLMEDPFPRGKLIKKIRGKKSPFYRLRVGRYRVFYSIEGQELAILRFISKKDTEHFIGNL